MWCLALGACKSLGPPPAPAAIDCFATTSEVPHADACARHSEQLALAAMPTSALVSEPPPPPRAGAGGGDGGGGGGSAQAPPPKPVDLKVIGEGLVKKLTGRGGALEGGFQAPFWSTHRDAHWTDTPRLNANGKYAIIIFAYRTAGVPRGTLVLGGQRMQMIRMEDSALRETLKEAGIYALMGAATTGSSSSLTVEYDAGRAADSLMIAIQYF
jgi:hypothetical protein